MTSEETKPTEEETPSPDAKWEQRVLCSDESCTGTIGLDGNCRVCGKPYDGDAPIPTQEDEAETAAMREMSEADEDEIDEADASVEEVAETDSLETTGADWDERVLCSDDSCVGTIGADGRCRVCGKRPGGK